MNARIAGLLAWRVESTRPAKRPVVYLTVVLLVAGAMFRFGLS